MIARDSFENVLNLTRVFSASRQVLWNAWTDPNVIVTWLGPPDWPADKVEADVRVGGQWRAELRSKQGEILVQSGKYLEVRAPESLSFTFRWEGDNHEDGVGVETLVEVRFEEKSSHETLMYFSQTRLASPQSVEGHTQGWRGTFDRLASVVDNMAEQSPRRVFRDRSDHSASIHSASSAHAWRLAPRVHDSLRDSTHQRAWGNLAHRVSGRHRGYPLPTRKSFSFSRALWCLPRSLRVGGAALALSRVAQAISTHRGLGAAKNTRLSTCEDFPNSRCRVLAEGRF